jgi:hypothetical protein
MDGTIAASPADCKEEPYDKWRAESDLRTLTEAKQIEKSPARMKHVRRAAKEKLAEMEALKKYANGGE